MTEHERLKFWIHLLELEVEALRSVLSECREKQDMRMISSTQWDKAEAIEQLKNSLVRP